ncbi:MAG TPA: SRPBCC family protein [Chloroflexota bacterium]|nr:SRPBCC family protein [Chloroflexota bacterium]
MQRAESSIRIAAPVAEVYRFWRDFENLPVFMENVKEVRQTADGVWRWRVKGPLNTSVQFDARMTEDQPNKAIGWNSNEGAIGTSGVVTFTDLQDNTEVHVVMQWFDTPMGRAGESLSHLIADPEQMLEEDLRRLKGELERRVREHVSPGATEAPLTG